MEVIDPGQDNKIEISVLREMILNKYLFQANKMEMKKNRLIVTGLVILRYTMSNSLPVTGFALYPLKILKTTKI